MESFMRLFCKSEQRERKIPQHSNRQWSIGLRAPSLLPTRDECILHRSICGEKNQARIVITDSFIQSTETCLTGATVCKLTTGLKAFYKNSYKTAIGVCVCARVMVFAQVISSLINLVNLSQFWMGRVIVQKWLFILNKRNWSLSLSLSVWAASNVSLLVGGLLSA